ncbi:hypothetical protein B0O99DRAFT_683588 [Bisporella sp. PMI_857]|nr:hypothetical protein B0O99DRAFT_683588 [Bisporella sp. PMI_857]
MSAQQDLQDLLRLLTTGRNKLTMMAAMQRVKALQAIDLRSIASIANANLEAISTAIKDPKAAKSLQTACKSAIKDPSSSKKRLSDTPLSSSSKRTKSAYELPPEADTPQAIEKALELPRPSTDEEAIEKCTIWTNRAPLVLAFAVSVLRYTMPEQPLSSRLSLGQAIVSANSRSKAVSLGLESGKGAEEAGWGQGQPKVRVLGREVHVLKRGDYDWKGEEGKEEAEGSEKPTKTFSMFNAKKTETKEWVVSATVTLKKSTFVARTVEVSSMAEAKSEIRKLLASDPSLAEATHNITAFRVPRDQGGVLEECNDDGESGGGKHILSLMQANNVVGVLLVVTRWYGGIMLGPDRWRLMTQVSNDALSQRLRVSGIVGQEALWGLDLEGMRSTNAPVTGGTAAGMSIFRPEGARNYLLKSFPCPSPTGEGTKKKRTVKEVDIEKERNLGLLLGALDILFGSWVEHISCDELDRRAWSWYVQVRPDVESGTAGWGGKGEVKLKSILDLRRKG